MNRKTLRYRKMSHGDYRVFVGREVYQFGNSHEAKKFYRQQLAERGKAKAA